ncbi:type II secretion system protein GspM [Massilia sp. DWR3-1-1]|uniref:type II secretion system protein GspM n=1 Tax=Massilia sp. DWR3-1-1 TaxID=2804559 RepID=UPI003CFB0433
MSAASSFSNIKSQLALGWIARTEQERKFLTIGAGVVLGTLVYLLFISPAVSGRAQLEKALPQLRQEAAQLRSMALEASELSRQAPAQGAPMARETLLASLTAMGITPQSLTMTGEFAKVQLSAVPFSSLVGWLDNQRREGRISVQDASIGAAGEGGKVDATLTLRQEPGAR